MVQNSEVTKSRPESGRETGARRAREEGKVYGRTPWKDERRGQVRRGDGQDKGPPQRGRRCRVRQRGPEGRGPRGSAQGHRQREEGQAQGSIQVAEAQELSYPSRGRVLRDPDFLCCVERGAPFR